MKESKSMAAVGPTKPLAEDPGDARADQTPRDGVTAAMLFPLRWYWNASYMRPIHRKGQRCRILARGKRNSVLVEFPDAFLVVTSGWAVRKAATT